MGGLCGGGTKNAEYSDSESSDQTPVGPMQAIDKRLWLGNKEAAEDENLLKQNGITHICSIGWDLHKDEKMRFQQIEYLVNNEVYDAPEQDIMPIIKRCLEWIDKALENPKNTVFVHCHKGISRSSTLAVAYYMRKYKVNLADALKHVRKCRKVAVVSLGFEFQLDKFYKNDYSLDLNNYKNHKEQWEPLLEAYLRDVVLVKAKDLRKQADKTDGDYSGRMLFALTANFHEIHRYQIKYGTIPQLKDEGVEIVLKMQEDFVGDEDTISTLKHMFGLELKENDI